MKEVLPNKKHILPLNQNKASKPTYLFMVLSYDLLTLSEKYNPTIKQTDVQEQWFRLFQDLLK